MRDGNLEANFPSSSFQIFHAEGPRDSWRSAGLSNVGKNILICYYHYANAYCILYSCIVSVLYIDNSKFFHNHHLGCRSHEMTISWTSCRKMAIVLQCPNIVSGELVSTNDYRNLRSGSQITKNGFILLCTFFGSDRLQMLFPVYATYFRNLD